MLSPAITHTSLSLSSNAGSAARIVAAPKRSATAAVHETRREKMGVGGNWVEFMEANGPTTCPVLEHSASPVAVRLVFPAFHPFRLATCTAPWLARRYAARGSRPRRMVSALRGFAAARLAVHQRLDGGCG